jgi:hypothetical protein
MIPLVMAFITGLAFGTLAAVFLYIFKTAERNED